MRTASLLAMAVAMAATYPAATTFTHPYPQQVGPRGPGGKTNNTVRRAKSKAAKQARKKQRGRK